MPPTKSSPRHASAAHGAMKEGAEEGYACQAGRAALLEALTGAHEPEHGTAGPWKFRGRAVLTRDPDHLDVPGAEASVAVEPPADGEVPVHEVRERRLVAGPQRLDALVGALRELLYALLDVRVAAQP